MPRRLLYVLTLVLLTAAPSAAAQNQADVRIRRAAEEALAARLSGPARQTEVRVRRTGGMVDSARPLRLVFPPAEATPEGLTQVQVQTRTDVRGWHKTGWALLYVARFDSVVVARTRLRGDAPMHRSDVQVAWTETTNFRGEPLRASDFRALAAEQPVFAARTLAAGRTLRRSDVRPPYAADTGAAVEMRYARGALVFRLSCKAREPGFAQETIRLYCPNTRTTYRARLTSPGTAEWIETL